MAHFTSCIHPLSPVSPLGSVVVDPVNFTVNETDNVTFMCSGEGGPGNRYAWFFGGTGRSNTTVLEVSNIAAENGGDYICEVSNAAGSGRQSGQIFGKYIATPHSTHHPAHTTPLLTCSLCTCSQPCTADRSRW